MQLIYTILYLSMLISRFEVSNSYHQNKDLEDIILSHRVEKPKYSDSDETYFSSVTELVSLNEIALWFESFQKDFYMRTITVVDDLTLGTSTYDLFYLLNDKNYIMFQGITICIQLLDQVYTEIDKESFAGVHLTVETQTEPIEDIEQG